MHRPTGQGVLPYNQPPTYYGHQQQQSRQQQRSQQHDSRYHAPSPPQYWPSAPAPAYDPRPKQMRRATPPKAVMLCESPSMGSVNFGDETKSRQEYSQRESGVWARMSLMLHSQEPGRVNEKSTWLEGKQSSSRKWLFIGWAVVVLLALAVAGVLVWYFCFHTRTSSTYATPSVPNLGGLNSRYTGQGVAEATSTAPSLSPTTAARIKRALHAHSLEKRRLEH